MYYIAGNPRRNLNGEPLTPEETPEQEIERLHKQSANGDAPRYFALSEAGL